MKLVLFTIIIVSARLTNSQTDGLETDSLSRSSRDLIGYNRVHNTAQIHRLKAFQNTKAVTRTSTKSMDDFPNETKLSKAEMKRWTQLRQQLAAIRRLRRARLLQKLGY